MKRQIYTALSIFAMLFAQGCAQQGMTYFRKTQASVADERRDWGLCGGNFLANGEVLPKMTPKVLICMRDHGYQSINDYYVEQQLSFIDNVNSTVISIFDTQIDQYQCGFRRTQGLCKVEPYIPRSRLSNVISCMSSNGYEATLPRYKSAFRIIEDTQEVSPNFCLALTPRSGNGGVSLGGWRLE